MEIFIGVGGFLYLLGIDGQGFVACIGRMYVGGVRDVANDVRHWAGVVWDVPHIAVRLCLHQAFSR
jgi:hypothetical protein